MFKVNNKNTRATDFEHVTDFANFEQVNVSKEVNLIRLINFYSPKDHQKAKTNF